MPFPTIPEKYYPAMITVGLTLMIFGIALYYYFPQDIIMPFIAGGLFGFGSYMLFDNIREWTKEYYGEREEKRKRRPAFKVFTR